MMSDNQDKRDPEEMSVQLNEAFERLEAARDHDQAEPDEPQEGVAPAPRGRSVAGILALFLALIALGVASGAAYLVWRQAGDSGEIASRLERQLDNRLTAMESEVASSEGDTDERVARAIERLTALEREVDARLAAVDDINAQLDAVSSQLADGRGDRREALDDIAERVDIAIAGLRAEMGTSSQDWLLAEVEYLIRLGAQRVEMQQDATGALAMFRTADDILRQAEGIAAFGLREALANDIAELQSVETIDVDGIYVKLGALKQQVDLLRQSTSAFTGDAPALETPASDATLVDRVLIFVRNVGARLASLIDYRRDAETVKPVLPPKEEYYLRQNLIFQLQLAQLALLRENQQIFDRSLEEASMWVRRHFDPDHAVTETMLRTLDELTGINVTREMPDVSQSLRAVRETLNRFRTESQRNQVR